MSHDTNTFLDPLGSRPSESAHHEPIFDSIELILSELTHPVEAQKQRSFPYKALVHYVVTTLGIFALLLAGTNYSAYATLISAAIAPESSGSIATITENVISNGNITIWAATGTEAPESENQQIEKLEDSLQANDTAISLDPFAPKRLLPITEDPVIDIEITPYDNRIIIPKIGKNIPLVDVDPTTKVSVEDLHTILMRELEKGIVQYPGTAKPGEIGNAFIFGHSSYYPWADGGFKDVFARLNHLVVGDEIIVFYQQKKYVYRVTDKTVVKPGDVTIFKRDPSGRELSLMTCWPIGTTYKRLVVFSELISSN